jgi:hypothetical protein
MSETPESEEMYSMAVDDASHIKKQTRAQIDIIDDLLRSHYTTDVPADEFSENLLSLLCEVNNINIRLYNLVDQHIEEQPREEVNGEEELILNGEQMALIQALTLSQYMINSEMVRYENISTALH